MRGIDAEKSPELRAISTEIKAGNQAIARSKLSAHLKANPDDPAAYYVASMLAVSEAQRIGLLEKALSLDPTYERARVKLESIRPVAPPVAAATLPPSPVKPAKPARSSGVLLWAIALTATAVAVLFAGLYFKERQSSQAIALILSATKTPTTTSTPTPSSTATSLPTATAMPTKTERPTETLPPTDTPQPAATATSTISKGGWRFNEKRSALDDSLTQTILLDSDAKVITAFGGVQPVLVIRCQKRALDVYVNVGTQLDYDASDSRSSIRFRFDKEPLDVVMGDISTANDAVFFPDARPIVSKLKSHSQLAIAVRDYKQIDLEMTFTLNGFNKAYEPLAENCK